MQPQLIQPVSYCLYARKSSESDERQAMSIDSQIKEMRSLAAKENLLIKDIRQESHSAKISGQRPVFMQLLADIRQEVFNGILTWASDRLSRNAGDLGKIVDLMDQGKLTQIKTFSQIFSNNPNEKFLLMILCSQAKLENDQKGLNVKRGIRAKCEMGWRPGMAPLGFFNRAYNGTKDIIIDPQRGPLIQEMFEKVARDGTSGRTLLKWLQEKQFTNRSGAPICLSQIYLALKNPFYMGKFEYPVGSGQWYKGSYQPLISEDIFNQVQKRLVIPPKTKWGTKSFTFKGLFKCASCGSNLVGEDKYRQRKNRPPKYHVYYHCSRSIDYNCPEPFITEEKLAGQLFRYINFMYMAHPQILYLSPVIRDGMEHYKKVRDEVLLYQDIDPETRPMDIRDYAKHVLKTGSIDQKRSLIQLFNYQLYLHNRTVTATRENIT